MAVVLNYWICLIVTFLWDTANSLKIISLHVGRENTNEALLNCLYDLEKQPLYDVKWYKDDSQFFRCMANGSVQEFPVNGVTIYYSSNAVKGSCPVTLINLTDNSGGQYKCEISLDEPKFRTVSEMRVLKIPQYSRRTQDRNEINPEKIKSPSQNKTNPSRSGMVKPTRLLHIYLVIFIILFCRF